METPRMPGPPVRTAVVKKSEKILDSEVDKLLSSEGLKKLFHSAFQSLFIESPAPLVIHFLLPLTM